MRQAAGLAIALILGFHAGPSRAAVASQVQVEVDFLSFGASYGESVAIFEDVLAVGAPDQDDGLDDQVGAVMLFRRVGNGKPEQQSGVGRGIVSPLHFAR